MIIINCTEDDMELARTSAGLRWVLLMLHYWAYSRNRPMATDEKNKNSSLFQYGFHFPSWQNVGKIINTVAT